MAERPRNGTDILDSALDEDMTDINLLLQKQVGAFNKLQFLEGLEAFSVATFTSVLGWSIEEVQVFLALVRKDAKDRKVHMMHNL